MPQFSYFFAPFLPPHAPPNERVITEYGNWHQPHTTRGGRVEKKVHTGRAHDWDQRESAHKTFMQTQTWQGVRARARKMGIYLFLRGTPLETDCIWLRAQSYVCTKANANFVAREKKMHAHEPDGLNCGLLSQLASRYIMQIFNSSIHKGKKVCYYMVNI